MARRLKKKYRRILWGIIIGIVLIVIACKAVSGCGSRYEPSTYIPTITNLKRSFNDLNPLHVEAGRSSGLKEAPKDRNDIHTGGLKEISSCKYYKVNELTHSVPYLTRGGKKLLDQIGVNFRDSLDAKGICPSRFIVTSVLRTQEDINRLRKSGNVNASANSSHCYGCTFDIAWYSFDMPRNTNATWDQYRGVLAEVLRDLRKEGACYVKYEAKETCFHITSRL